MKLATPTFTTDRSTLAFTLHELMIAMALFGMMLVGILGVHLFGMRLYRITETKLSAASSARKALNLVRDQVRSGKMLIVGNGSDSSFKAIADNLNQTGNAIQIYATTNTNTFVRIYLDPADNSLKRYISDGGKIDVIASYITNQLVFSAEDFQGKVLTNNQNNRVIRLMLEFYQWEFPIASVGGGSMYDYYRLNTRITRRSIE